MWSWLISVRMNNIHNFIYKPNITSYLCACDAKHLYINILHSFQTRKGLKLAFKYFQRIPTLALQYWKFMKQTVSELFLWKNVNWWTRQTSGFPFYIKLITPVVWVPTNETIFRSSQLVAKCCTWELCANHFSFLRLLLLAVILNV